MLKLTYKTVKDPNFVQSFNKLATYSNFNFKTTKRIYKLGKELKAALDEVADLHKLLVKKYAILDEAGEIKDVEGKGPGTYQIREEVKDEWEKAYEEFDNNEIEVNAEPLLSQFLEGAPLCAADLGNIEPVISDLS